ncbi:hypothetical protein CEXT_683291 [Caerostris extrusa]|uniref:Uncharacterized protein n=1 Tax=Caerostris extrusa TaxID=172846 RepID=A0AAV4V9M1_CAEEX|nr:hypothetical protein CEXT_683291 [Caerostris extrusa]
MPKRFTSLRGGDSTDQTILLTDRETFDRGKRRWFFSKQGLTTDEKAAKPGSLSLAVLLGCTWDRTFKSQLLPLGDTPTETADIWACARSRFLRSFSHIAWGFHQHLF